MSCELLFSRLEGRTWAARREGGAVVELRADDPGDGPAVGRIFRARVTAVHPGLDAAFLDLGDGRAAFLPASRLRLPGEPAAASGAPLEDRLAAGRELVVQISKAAAGRKAPRATCAVGLAGRWLVLYPGQGFRRLSRRIADPRRREELSALLRSWPGADGYVARTAAAHASDAALHAEARELGRRWSAIARETGHGPPRELWREPDLVTRMLEEVGPHETDRVAFDDPELHAAAARLVEASIPELAPKLRLVPGPPSLFERERVWPEVEACARPVVPLPSGGRITIEETESIVAIDVDTGSDPAPRGAGGAPLRSNLEAAIEIARQLRLRDLGGAIVVDFVEIRAEADRRRVVAALEAALVADPARTKVLGPSELGLVELSRQSRGDGIGRVLWRRCEVCGGRAPALPIHAGPRVPQAGPSPSCGRADRR